jgi:hypothetical protein
VRSSIFGSDHGHLNRFFVLWEKERRSTAQACIGGLVSFEKELARRETRTRYSRFCRSKGVETEASMSIAKAKAHKYQTFQTPNSVLSYTRSCDLRKHFCIPFFAWSQWKPLSCYETRRIEHLAMQVRTKIIPDIKEVLSHIYRFLELTLRPPPTFILPPALLLRAPDRMLGR